MFKSEGAAGRSRDVRRLRPAQFGGQDSDVLPVSEAHGEGDRGTRWRGHRPSCPSTMLRMVPLPIRFADREERRSVDPRQDVAGELAHGAVGGGDGVDEFEAAVFAEAVDGAAALGGGFAPVGGELAAARQSRRCRNGRRDCRTIRRASSPPRPGGRRRGPRSLPRHNELDEAAAERRPDLERGAGRRCRSACPRRSSFRPASRAAPSAPAPRRARRARPGRRARRRYAPASGIW